MRATERREASEKSVRPLQVEQRYRLVGAAELGWAGLDRARSPGGLTGALQY